MNKSKKKIPPIARNIRNYRTEKGLLQDKPSKLAEVSFNTITKIEEGDTPNPTVETVKKIADALGLTVDDLLR
jgi:transcriptional regulator with XRE-family HTH domain